MSILTTSDFKQGEYSLSLDQYTELDTYIAKYEKFYLLRLLGADLYALFIADLVSGVPQTQRFIDIFNAFQEDSKPCLMISEGIKEMLKAFIYFHYSRETVYQKTPTGAVIPNPEVSTNLGYNGFNLVTAYNKGVETFNVIQWFMLDGNDYPEYNGQCIEFMSGI